MPRVFAVSTGDYEQHWPIALFTDKPAAEKFAAEVHGSLDEMVLDDPSILAGIPRWLVRINKRGEVTKPTIQSDLPPRQPGDLSQDVIGDEFWLTIAAPTSDEAEKEALWLVAVHNGRESQQDEEAESGRP